MSGRKGFNEAFIFVRDLGVFVVSTCAFGYGIAHVGTKIVEKIKST